MRAFLAVSLPADVRASLAVLQRGLAHSNADVKWVEPENLHVTLRFLGEITEEQRLALEALLERLAPREEPFVLGLEGIGAFPSLGSPRVFWVGLSTGRETAARIAGAIEREGATILLEKAERPFAAHVTLGRVRSPRHRPALVQRLRETSWRAPDPWRVSALTLYQSVLGPGGPRYTVLAEVPLGGRSR